MSDASTLRTGPALSVVIPCYNEANTIEEIVNAVRAAPVDGLEIIVVDDASTDGTIDVLRSRIEPLVSKVLYHERNHGKGAALRTGFSHATGEMVVVQDADLEYDPQEYPELIAPDPGRAGRTWSSARASRGTGRTGWSTSGTTWATAS